MHILLVSYKPSVTYHIIFSYVSLEPSIARHVGLNVYIQLDLLRNKGFRNVLAYAATSARSHCKARMVAICSAGKHRSVASVCLLSKLFHLINHDIQVNIEHLEAPNRAGWTCADRCTVCAANRTPQEMIDLLLMIKDSMPCKTAVQEVTLY